MVKNPSTRPPQNYYLCPASKSVHEMDGPWSKIRPLVHLKIIILVRCPNLSMRWTVWAQILGPLSTWPGGRMDGPQTVVFVRGGLASTLVKKLVKVQILWCYVRMKIFWIQKYIILFHQIFKVHNRWNYAWMCTWNQVWVQNGTIFVFKYPCIPSSVRECNN